MINITRGVVTFNVNTKFPSEQIIYCIGDIFFRRDNASYYHRKLCNIKLFFCIFTT